MAMAFSLACSFNGERTNAGRRVWRFWLCAAALAGTAWLPAAAAPMIEGWTMMLGPPPVEATTRLCLSDDGSLASVFSYKRWRASIDPAAGTFCKELLAADLRRGMLYFDFDNAYRWRRRLIGEVAAEGPCMEGPIAKPYQPCTSRFFVDVYDAHVRGYRALDELGLKAALTKTGAITLLKQAVVDLRAREDAAQYAKYRADFDAATTLDRIIAFERTYASWDQDKLIPALQSAKQRLAHEQYVAAFHAAKSSTELASFIERYAGDDPDSLVPVARQKRAAADVQEAAQRRKEAAAKLQAERVAKQKQRQGQLSYCRRMLALAYQALERERNIEAVSGVQNLTVKRQAGEMIVTCERIIARGY
jgi:hypothetical protein